jgi:ABC-type transport system involved in cytochrome c biogenesis permease subunit
MYCVPAAPKLDKRLRRAIYLAVILASFSSGLLFSVLLGHGTWISLVLYLGLLRACWVSSAKGSLKGLLAIAAFSVALILACLGIVYIPAFGFRRDTPGNWHVFITPISMLSMGALIGQWVANRVQKVD